MAFGRMTGRELDVVLHDVVYSESWPPKRLKRFNLQRRNEVVCPKNSQNQNTSHASAKVHELPVPMILQISFLASSFSKVL